MELSDIIEAILDQTTNNKITITIERNSNDFMEIVVSDNLSEICNIYEYFTDKAVYEAKEQLESFVDGLNNG